MCRLGYSCHSAFSCPQLGVEAGPCAGVELLMNSSPSSFSGSSWRGLQRKACPRSGSLSYPFMTWLSSGQGCPDVS